jgi:hypothetical protein
VHEDLAEIVQALVLRELIEKLMGNLAVFSG